MLADEVIKQPLPWHAQAWTQLRNAYESKRFPHAILLAGQEGLGKRVFATQLSQLLLCEQPEWARLESCAKCPSCIRNAQDAHPDFRRLEPAEDKKEISVDDVRNILNYIQLSAHSSAGNKVVVIDPADKMTRSAANAILKSLEEPPNKRIIILIAESLSKIPATIRSRCQLIRFSNGPEKLITPWLIEISKGKYQPGKGIQHQLPPFKRLENINDEKSGGEAIVKKLKNDWHDLIKLNKSAITIASDWHGLNDNNYVTHWLYAEIINALKFYLIEASGNSGSIFVETGINTEAVLKIQNKLNEFANLEDSNANSKLLWETFLLSCQSVARLSKAA